MAKDAKAEKARLAFAKAMAAQEKHYEKNRGKAINLGGDFSDKPIEKGAYRARILKPQFGATSKGKPYFSYKMAIYDPGKEWHGNTYGQYFTIDFSEVAYGGQQKDGYTNGDLCIAELRLLGYDTNSPEFKNLTGALPEVVDQLTTEQPWVQVYCSPKEAEGDKKYRVYVSLNKLLPEDEIPDDPAFGTKEEAEEKKAPVKKAPVKKAAKK